MAAESPVARKEGEALRDMDETSPSISFKTPDTTTAGLRLSKRRSPRSVRSGKAEAEMLEGSRSTRAPGEEFGVIQTPRRSLAEERTEQQNGRTSTERQRAEEVETVGNGSRDRSRSYGDGSSVGLASLAGALVGYTKAGVPREDPSNPNPSLLNKPRQEDYTTSRSLMHAERQNDSGPTRSQEDSRSFTKDSRSSASQTNRISTVFDKESSVTETQHRSFSSTSGTRAETDPAIDKRTVSVEVANASGRGSQFGQTGEHDDSWRRRGSTRRLSHPRTDAGLMERPREREEYLANDTRDSASLLDTTHTRLTSHTVTPQQLSRLSTRDTSAQSALPVEMSREASIPMTDTAQIATTPEKSARSVSTSARQTPNPDSRDGVSIQGESPRLAKTVESKTTPLLESAVERHVLTWFEQHHLLEREATEAAKAEAEAQEGLRRALAAEFERPLVSIQERQERFRWWNALYVAIMILLAM